MATYGEFIKTVQETDSADAREFIAEWMACATPAQWVKYRTMTLTDGEVLNFAEDMAGYFKDRLIRTAAGDLYDALAEGGHRFLRGVHAKAAALGIVIPVAEINLPLTSTEICRASGATATYGQFIEAVRETKHSSAKTFMAEWVRQGTAYGVWEGSLDMPLTRPKVLEFASGMADSFRRLILGATAEFAAALVEEGHAFLQEIQAKAAALGIVIPAAEIDGPLTADELGQALITSGLIQIAPLADIERN